MQGCVTAVSRLASQPAQVVWLRVVLEGLLAACSRLVIGSQQVQTPQQIRLSVGNSVVMGVRGVCREGAG